MKYIRIQKHGPSDAPEQFANDAVKAGFSIIEDSEKAYIDIPLQYFEELTELKGFKAIRSRLIENRETKDTYHLV